MKSFPRNDCRRQLAQGHDGLPLCALILTVVVLATMMPAPAAAKLDRFKKGKLPDLTQYKEEGHPAVLLYKSRVIKAKKPDFFMTEIEWVDEMWVALLTSEGIEQYGDYESQTFHKDRKIKFEAKILQPDGSETKVDKSHIREVKIGKNLRQHVVALPDLQVGSVIAIETKWKGGVFISYDGTFACAAEVPVMEAYFHAEVPEEGRVKFHMYPRGAMTEGLLQEKKDGDKIQYTVHSHNMPASVREPYMPRLYKNAPKFRYIVEGQVGYKFPYIDFDAQKVRWLEWGRLGSLDKLYFGIMGPEDKEKYADNIREFAYELGANATYENQEERYEAVVKNFKERFDVETGEFGWEYPPTCLENGSGNCFGAAYVLMGCLERAGATVSPVFMIDRAHGYPDHKVKDFRMYTRILLLLSDGDKRYWVDPVDPVSGLNELPWEVVGTHGLGIYADGRAVIAATPDPDPADNVIEVMVNGELSAEGALRATVRTRLTGEYYLGGKREGTSKEPVIEQVKERFEPYGEVELKEDDVEVNLEEGFYEIRYAMTLPAFARAAGGILYFDTGFLDRLELAKAFVSDDRLYDVSFRNPATMRAQMQIKLPEGYSLKSEPHSRTLENESMGYVKQETVVDGLFQVKRVFMIKTPDIPKAEYSPMKAFLEQVREADVARVVLERTQG
jgi:hypothetical protein